jgi:hypothetical protein
MKKRSDAEESEKAEGHEATRRRLVLVGGATLDCAV